KRILGRGLREYYLRWPDPDQAPTYDQLHDLRISGKRLRYSAESLRDLYPDRLSLLIELLKRGQDLLGEIQDCTTHRNDWEKDLSRLKRRNPQSGDIAALENLIADSDRRQAILLEQFREIWRGLTMAGFRKGLKAMISRASESESKMTGMPAENLDHQDTKPHLVIVAATPSISHD